MVEIIGVYRSLNIFLVDEPIEPPEHLTQSFLWKYINKLDKSAQVGLCVVLSFFLGKLGIPIAFLVTVFSLYMIYYLLKSKKETRKPLPRVIKPDTLAFTRFITMVTNLKMLIHLSQRSI